MARRRPVWDIRRSVSIVLGVTLVGLAAWYAWDHFRDPSAPIAAAFGAAMLHFAEHAWGERQRVRAAMMAALSLLAVVISLSAVVDRVSSAKDGRVHTTASDNEMRRLAEHAHTQAVTEHAEERAAARQECNRSDNPKADPRGPKCLAAEAREQQARERLDNARQRLAVIGVAKIEDPGARRLAAILPLSEAQLSLYLPLLLPIWLELSGLVLLTYGLSRRAAAPVVAKATRKRRKPRRKTVTPPQNVIAFPKKP